MRYVHLCVEFQFWEKVFRNMNWKSGICQWIYGRKENRDFIVFLPCDIGRIEDCRIISFHIKHVMNLIIVAFVTFSFHFKLDNRFVSSLS